MEGITCPRRKKQDILIEGTPGSKQVGARRAAPRRVRNPLKRTAGAAPSRRAWRTS